MHDQTVNILFHLLRLGVGSKSSFTIPSHTPWLDVMKLAELQNVLALSFDALAQIPGEERPEMDTLMGWLGQASYIEATYEHKEKCLRILDNALVRYNLRCAVIKGYSLSLYYPNPKHREFGDIDVVTFGRDNKLVDKAIVVAGGKLVDDVSKHSEYDVDGIIIESHRIFTENRTSRRNKELNDCLYNELDKCKPIPGFAALYKLEPEWDLVYVLEHAATHFRLEGIQLKHVADWMMMVRCIGSEYNEALLDRFNLTTFAHILNRISKEHLGLCIDDKYCDCNDTQYNQVLQDIINRKRTTVCESGSCSQIAEKYKRFTSRNWTYPITGESYFNGIMRSIIGHIERPDLIAK